MQAWEKAMTPCNIVSHFRACGIYPFNPEAVPSSAFLPSTLYTSRPAETKDVATFIQEQGPTGNDPPVGTSKSTGVSAPCSVIDINMIRYWGLLKLLTPEQPVRDANKDKKVTWRFKHTWQHLPPSSTRVRHDGLHVSNLYYAVLPPEQALNILEKSLTEKQYHCFVYCRENKLDINQDKMFACWNKLRNI